MKMRHHFYKNHVIHMSILLIYHSVMSCTSRSAEGTFIELSIDPTVLYPPVSLPNDTTINNCLYSNMNETQSLETYIFMPFFCYPLLFPHSLFYLPHALSMFFFVIYIWFRLYHSVRSCRSSYKHTSSH